MSLFSSPKFSTVCAAVVVASCVYDPVEMAAEPLISEIMASNSSTFADEDGDFSDWIEISNTGPNAVDLDGYFLTDSTTSPTKWRFPEVSIAPGGFLVVFASDKDRDIGELHTNFKLSAGGEYLALIAPDGISVVNSYDPEFPSMGQDISFGINSSGDTAFFNLPTPGEANGIGDAVFVVPPVFSESSRLFIGSLSLGISNPGAAGTVRYTTDGSVPTSSSAAFSGNLLITEPKTVKALIDVPSLGQSRIVTAHFSPIAADLQNFNSNLPITVVDAEEAITNRSNNGDPKQDVRIFVIPVNALSGRASIIDTAQVITRAGTNIRGNTSATKEKKNYNVEFWKEIEEDRTHLTSNEALPRDRNKKLLGMPAEADWVLYGLDLAHERSYFNNAFIYGIARDLDFPAPRTRYCELFINPGNAAVAFTDYRGIYMWQEQITVGNDRIDLKPFNSGETNPVELGGYIVRVNDVGGTDLSFRTREPYNTPTYDGHSFSVFAPTTYDPNHPGRNTLQNVKPADRDRIRNYVSDFEETLFADNFFDSINGYRKYIEPRSFMLWHSLQEFGINNDIYTASIYMEKDVGERLRMSSLWDFDWAFTRAHYVAPGGGTPYLEWWYNNPNNVNLRDTNLVPWFLRLAEDPEYLSDWHDLWAGMRSGVLSDSALDARLDALAAELQEATVRDQAKFGGIPLSTQVSEMKSWTKGRAAWMDSELGGLPPSFSHTQGIVPAGTMLTVSKGSGQPGQIYYTLDGSDPRLPETPVTPGTPVTLTPRGSVWEYLDNGSNAGTAWRTATGGWNSGPAELGYGDGGENTLVARGPFGARYITTYFRREIAIPTLADFSGFRVFLKRDDGAVVYVNGVEVVRSNLPAFPAPIDYLTPASSPVLAADEDTFFEFTIGTEAFVTGANVIAVEVHQDGPGASDLSFDLELIGISGGAGDSGGPSPEAVTAPNPIPLEGIVKVTARSYDGTNWSPVAHATYIVGGELAAAGNLAVSEIYYHPRPAEPAFGEEESAEGGFEFVEITNISSTALNLAGVSLTNGIDVLLPADTVIPIGPGARAVLVDDTSAFRSRFGTEPVILGNYSGALGNGGDTLELRAADGSLIESITYGDSSPWPTRADGAGSSLERNNLASGASDAANWNPSVEVDGSPGIAGAGSDGRIVVNEVLSNSLPPLTDAIEFLNTTAAAINVGGWFVSDNAEIRKYSFPKPTVIAPGAHILIDESDFNPGGGTNATDFALDSVGGDGVWLVEADAFGKLLRFVDVIQFGESSNGRSFGRVPDGSGTFQPLTNSSLGLNNSASYEGWALDTFPPGASPQTLDPQADPDGDGLSNLMEFALVLPPLVSQGSPIILHDTGTRWEITYTRRTPISGFTLKLAVTDNLAAWDKTESQIIQNVFVVPSGPNAERVTDAYVPTEGVTGQMFRLEMETGN